MSHFTFFEKIIVFLLFNLVTFSFLLQYILHKNKTFIYYLFSDKTEFNKRFKFLTISYLICLPITIFIFHIIIYFYNKLI